MKVHFNLSRLAAFVALLSSVCLSASDVRAQAQPPASAGAKASKYKIAVVDISYIFKNYPNFKNAMDGMKKNVQQTEELLRKEREQIGVLQEKMKQLNPGTPDYKQLDDQIAERMADFNLKANKKKKEFLESEAEIYHNTYVRVSHAVSDFARRHNIGLVLRFNGDPIDANSRPDVLRAINKPVIYQDGIDITPNILETLRRMSGTARNPARNGRAIPGVK